MIQSGSEHPGTNVTGTANFSSQWIGEPARLLKSLVPTLDKVGMVLNGNNANNAPQFELLKSEAQSLGIQVQSLDVRTPSDVVLFSAKHWISVLKDFYSALIVSSIRSASQS